MTAELELSEREREILRLVATGASNKEIAQQLVISPNTVKVHLRNIFAKIGVVSRTEAALYAIRIGLVSAPQEMPAFPVGEEPDAADVAAAQAALMAQAAQAAQDAPAALPARRPAWMVPVLAALLLLVLGAAAFGVYSLTRPQPPAAAASPTPASEARWESRAALPEARSGLAAAVFDGQIYTFGGEAPGGDVSGSAARYDPEANAWQPLASKPTPVTDIGAAQLGEKIYLPGGRLANGQLTPALEAYDPVDDAWESLSPLPKAISGYALAAFEGKLYLFGGWDGAQALNTVYIYTPDTDTWAEARSPMPTARAYAGAAVANGRIYVLGGWDGAKALDANEMYAPGRDRPGEEAPWQAKKPLPSPRYRMGVTSTADLVYLAGGLSTEGAESTPWLLEYGPWQDNWQPVSDTPGALGSRLALVPLESFIFVLGGEARSGGQLAPLAQNQAYRAVYTIRLPINTR